jgi:hypothetical protein
MERTSCDDGSRLLKHLLWSEMPINVSSSGKMMMLSHYYLFEKA